MSKRVFHDAERRGLVSYINHKLNTSINTESDDVLEEIKPGILLCDLVNAISQDNEEDPPKIPDVNRSPKNAWEINENHDRMLKASSGVGLKLVNVGATDLSAGTKHLIFGIIVQQVRFGLLRDVSNISALHDDMNLNLPPEQVLLMWINYHLKNAGVNRTVTDFGKSLADGEALTHVLNQITGGECDLAPLEEEDTLQRAELLLQESEKIDCRKFVAPSDIVEGNQRLNLQFIATLYTKYPDMGKGKNVELENANLDLQSLNLELKSKLEELVNENLRLNMDLTESNELTEQLTLAVDDYEEASTLTQTQYEEEANALREEMIALEEEVTDLKLVTNDNKQQVSDLMRQLAELQLRNKELELENTVHISEKQKCKEMREAVEQELAETQSKLADSLASEESLRETIARLEKELAEALTLLAEANEAKEKCEEVRDEIEHELVRTQNNLGAAQETVLVLEGELSDAQEANSQLRSQLDEANAKLSELDHEVETKTVMITKLQTQVEQMAADAASQKHTLSTRVEVVEKEIAEKSARLVQMQANVEEEKASSSRYRRQLQEADTDWNSKWNSANGRIEDLTAEVNRLKAALAEAYKVIDSMQAELDRQDKLMDDSVKEGWLQKLSPNSTLGLKFQKRFFVLKGVTLSYYKSEKDNRSRPTGVIDLTNARAYLLSSEESTKRVKTFFGFEIKVGGVKKLNAKQLQKSQSKNDGKLKRDEKLYVFVGGSTEESKSWCDTISKMKLNHLTRLARQKTLADRKEQLGLKEAQRSTLTTSAKMGPLAQPRRAQTAKAGSLGGDNRNTTDAAPLKTSGNSSFLGATAHRKSSTPAPAMRSSGPTPATDEPTQAAAEPAPQLELELAEDDPVDEMAPPYVETGEGQGEGEGDYLHEGEQLGNDAETWMASNLADGIADEIANEAHGEQQQQQAMLDTVVDDIMQDFEAADSPRTEPVDDIL